MLYKYRATVVKVIDGDTIDVDIDLGFFTVLHRQRIRGLESKAWLKHKIEGREIELVTFKDAKGKYGRWLGVIYFKNRNINEVMVKKELAVASN